MSLSEKISALQDKILTGVYTEADRWELYQAQSERLSFGMGVRPSLSLCAIVKNEQESLPQMLKSVAGQVDEIIIGDTGSVDQTVAIAREAGARVFHIPWEGDFAKARNQVLRRACMEWILVLDADEVVGHSDWTKIHALLTHPPGELLLFSQTTYTPAQSFIAWKKNDLDVIEARGFEGYFESNLTRLFRNKPSIQYVGAVHEHPFDLQTQATPIHSGIRIHHYGKLKPEAIQKRKSELYYELGLQKLREMPENAQAHYELAVQLLEMKRGAEAEPYFRSALKLDPGYHEARLTFADSLKNWGRTAEAVEQYGEHLARFPDDAHAYIFVSSLLIEIGKYDLALQMLTRARSLKKGDDALIRLNEGVVAMNLGYLDLARDHLLKADQIQPGYAPVQFNLACVAIKSGDLTLATAHLENVLKRDTGDQRALDLLKQIQKINRVQDNRSSEPAGRNHGT